jgi:hypothetical protein
MPPFRASATSRSRSDAFSASVAVFRFNPATPPRPFMDAAMWNVSNASHSRPIRRSLL